jgi:hypothetical protein
MAYMYFLLLQVAQLRNSCSFQLFSRVPNLQFLQRFWSSTKLCKPHPLSYTPNSSQSPLYHHSIASPLQLKNFAHPLFSCGTHPLPPPSPSPVAPTPLPYFPFPAPSPPSGPQTSDPVSLASNSLSPPFPNLSTTPSIPLTLSSADTTLRTSHGICAPQPISVGTSPGCRHRITGGEAAAGVACHCRASSAARCWVRQSQFHGVCEDGTLENMRGNRQWRCEEIRGEII